ncbi:MAG: ATP-grasp domain-containing protein [Agathobacter sp.]|nr:ATP-grasp domain-containing protein [Agathobacter sp.]
MKKVLVYPCGTEIGLEIYRALHNSIHYEIYGGSCSYDHGRFVYENHIDNLPFITDKSNEDEIKEFNKIIDEYNFDFIYPAMDGVLTVFSKYRQLLTPKVVAPDFETTCITRSKKNTYALFEKRLPVPYEYIDKSLINNFPIFVKPSVGQGSSGAQLIRNSSELEPINEEGMLFLEYLPGSEYTIDCFTNQSGELLYARGRERKRIKGGISVNAVFVDRPEFMEYAKIINANLKQRGGWFFQLKEAEDGKLKLLEIASRIAGTSAIVRNIGVNLPLLTLDVFDHHSIDSVIVNEFDIELDRALSNTFKIDLVYDSVYVDYDDTIVVNGKVNLEIINFLYQCINNNKKIILLSKHDGDLEEELIMYRIKEIFDKIIHLERNQDKKDYIKGNSIFIDDSYGERKQVWDACKVPVFDTHMIECLMER